ncbi:hypothetical protein SAMD00019534_071950, partial [Acytostelium subglobosum LB1]|uniref:hypothetical protein n=1 Tax=Acytostelium subglobosum LB1 TaxID=1410327 RepID=UPI00064506F5
MVARKKEQLLQPDEVVEMYDKDDLIAMLYVDVAAIARKRGLKASGKKVEIADRIIEQQNDPTSILTVDLKRDFSLNETTSNNKSLEPKKTPKVVAPPVKDVEVANVVSEEEDDDDDSSDYEDFSREMEEEESVEESEEEDDDEDYVTESEEEEEKPKPKPKPVPKPVTKKPTVSIGAGAKDEERPRPKPNAKPVPKKTIVSIGGAKGGAAKGGNGKGGYAHRLEDYDYEGWFEMMEGTDGYHDLCDMKIQWMEPKWAFLRYAKANGWEEMDEFKISNQDSD